MKKKVKKKKGKRLGKGQKQALSFQTGERKVLVKRRGTTRTPKKEKIRSETRGREPLGQCQQREPQKSFSQPTSQKGSLTKEKKKTGQRSQFSRGGRSSLLGDGERISFKGKGNQHPQQPRFHGGKEGKFSFPEKPIGKKGVSSRTDNWG